MIITVSRLSLEFSALQVPFASDLGPLDRANTLNPDTKTTHCAMTNHSKLHPGEFSRDIAKWQRGVIADIKQLTRGITRDGQVYLPQIVLAQRPRRVIRVTACQAPENMRMKDDSYVCWKDSSGTLVASQKVNWRPNRTRASRSSSRTAKSRYCLRHPSRSRDHFGSVCEMDRKIERSERERQHERAKRHSSL